MKNINLKYVHPKTLKTLEKVLDDSHKVNPILFSFLAAILASIGLATNSQTTILGSMLFSPIGSLINKSNISHFFEVHKHPTKKKYSHWVLPLMMVIGITIGVSFIFGLVFKQLTNPFTHEKLTKNWPTKEMTDRADPINALYMILIALVCGIALPLAIIFDSNVRIVAIGIATALIPPLANIGIALSTLGTEFDEHSKNAIITGFGIFIINVLLLWGPSRFLLEFFVKKNNFVKRIEKEMDI